MGDHDESTQMESGEAYQRFLEEARGEPIRFIKHDTNAHDDEAVYRMVSENGMAHYGWYWLLVECLMGRKGHTYDVSDDIGWKRLAYDMGCLCDLKPARCRQIVECFKSYGLISEEHYAEGRVAIPRILRDAETYAEGVADKKLGAWKTNRKRRGGA